MQGGDRGLGTWLTHTDGNIPRVVLLATTEGTLLVAYFPVTWSVLLQGNKWGSVIPQTSFSLTVLGEFSHILFSQQFILQA